MNDESSTLKSFLFNLAFGGVFLLVGALIFLVGMNVIHVDETSIHVPRWVIMASGMAFAFAGAMVMVQGLKSGFGDHPLYKWVYNAMVIGFLIVFAAPFHWIAFGPGEREFSSSVSIPFVSVGTSGGDLGGRLAFGCAAVMMDLILIALVLRVLRGKDLSNN
jgi:hypothetical protein